MEVKYRNTFWEMIWFNFYQLPRTLSSQIVAVFLIFFFGYYTYDILAGTDYSLPVKIISTLIVVSLLILAFILFLFVVLVVLQLSNQHYRSQIDQDCKLIVSNSGIVNESPTKRMEQHWSGIKKIHQTRNTILIYLSERSAILISKKAFRNEAEAKSFFDYALNLWKESKNVVLPA